MIIKGLKALGTASLWVVIALCLTITIAPAFLDRIYYTGPESDHFDGEYFRNLDGDIEFPTPPGARRGNIITRVIIGHADRPEWPTSVAVTTSRPPHRVNGKAMRATWVGHATVLVQTAGINILTDPIWSDYASPLPPLGPRRVAAPGVRFDDLPRIDIVVVSHNHYDHMDLPTLKRLWDRDRPLIVTSLGNDSILRNAGIPARALDWGQAVKAKGATVHVIRNHHWSSRWGKDRNRSLWSAFLIETPAGRIFFAGDTGLGDGQWADEARSYGPIRLSILPIGAFRFYPGQMVTGSHIGPREAVMQFQRMGASTAIPIHWGTFRLSNEAYDTPPAMLKLFVQCAGIPPSRFAPMAIGGAIDVPDWTPFTAIAGNPAPCREGSPQLSVLE